MNPEINPMVSIITPTFNRAPFIEQAVNSVLAQTYPEFELIIVDDGSTDDTKARLEPALEDSRVKYFFQSNQGQSVARNEALSHAKGEFICFLDSDNYWPKTKLEEQIDIFSENPDVDIVYGDTITIDEHGNELSRKNMKRYSGNIAKFMVRDNCVSMNTALARRKCFDELGGMNEKRRVADDYDLWLRFSAKYRYLYVPRFFAFYRVMENQISSDETRRFESNWLTINDFRQRFPDAMTGLEFDIGFAMFHIRKARYFGRRGQKGKALKEMVSAFGYRPFDKRCWRSLAAVLLK